MANVLDSLNSAQTAAVTSPAAVLQVLAPPGSGKTKTLTTRVAYLINERHLKPWNIIVCTFTVKAAREMKDRIKMFVGEGPSKHLKLGTFHSVALRYLRSYGQYISLPKDFGIADTADSKAILKRIIKRHGLQTEPKQALDRISSRKAKGTSEDLGKGVQQQEFLKYFDEYEAALADSHLLDYDDIILRCCSLLRSHPQCVSNVQAVLIDEFQDTNSTQYELMRLFAQQRNAITIVGDPDQSIYGFRSAEIKNLTRMKIHWPDTLTINLEENYRSSGAILHAAQNIIEQDESRPQKKLQATHSLGLRPVLRRLPSAAAEAEWLVSEIKRMQAVSGNMLQPDDFAVLVRSARLSRAIETALVSAGVPYRMVGGMRFYDRMEVKLVLDYLRVIHQPENSEAVERVVNVPRRGVGDETVRKLRDEAASRGVPLWSLFLDIVQCRRTPKTKLTAPARQGLTSFVHVILSGRKKVESWDNETQPSLVELIKLITQNISLQAFLKTKDSETETYEARWANVEELTSQAAEMLTPTKLSELADAASLPAIDGLEQRTESSQDMLSTFLANVALTASAERSAEENSEKVPEVTISTIHAAKGLEWPVVFIPACYDGSIPHSQADDDDEERRLLYVGMTRAQALLYLSCPIKSTRQDETTMSKFLTHSGAGSFFEEHGPSISFSAVTSMSMTLRRDCPKEAEVVKLKASLERDEDNFWPVNGEDASSGESRGFRKRGTSASSGPGFSSARAAAWATGSNITMQQPQNFSTASATMQTGFASVASQYDELMEQAKHRKTDKRENEKAETPRSPKGGGKRQINGQGNIATFFSKKPRTAPEPAQPPRGISSQPNTNAVGHTQHFDPLLTTQVKLSSHKPRFEPMHSRPKAEEQPVREAANPYSFLSSSPTKPDADGAETSPTEEDGDRRQDDASVPMRPATTLHTTSVAATAAAAAAPRRTLGVRRSVQGWSATRRPG